MRIVTLGGGTGNQIVLTGLKSKHHISAIVPVTDSGGATGLLREKFGILPPGDARNAVAALSEFGPWLRALFDYRFEEDGVVGGNKVGNVILSALNYGARNFDEAVSRLCQIAQTKGTVIPVTTDDVHIAVRMEDGTVIEGEKHIDVSDKNNFGRSHDIHQNIKDIWLTGGAGTLNPRAQEAIESADIVIIGPGDLFTSIIPILLSPGLVDSLHARGVPIVVVGNLSRKVGETTTYTVDDFIDTMRRFLGPAKPLTFIINNADHITESSIYAPDDYRSPGSAVIVTDVARSDKPTHHDPEKLVEVLENIIDHLG